MVTSESAGMLPVFGQALINLPPEAGFLLPIHLQFDRTSYVFLANHNLMRHTK
jgi:hypothetical protein